MSFAKATALLAAGAVLFGTSLFSRDRENPSWAWTSGDAAGTNLSELATAPLPALNAALPAKSQAPATEEVAGPDAQPSTAGAPARATSSGARTERLCAGKTCRHAHAPQGGRAAAVVDAKPAAVLVEPIQFRLATRGN
jgi:hypothetical protein